MVSLRARRVGGALGARTLVRQRVHVHVRGATGQLGPFKRYGTLRSRQRAPEVHAAAVAFVASGAAAHAALFGPVYNACLPRVADCTVRGSGFRAQFHTSATGCQQKTPAAQFQ